MTKAMMRPLTQLVNLQSPLSLLVNEYISEGGYQGGSKAVHEYQYLTSENFVEISADLANLESKHD
jgi:hypothetical protein